MALDLAADGAIRDFEEELRSVESHPPLALTPAWFQERLLEWATSDPDFRVKLLRFVDVLPTLRSTKAVADHVRQYFRGTHRPLIETASGIASTGMFRPILSQVVRQGVFAMAGRFIAGAAPAEALDTLRDLAKDGVGSAVDLLGEETLSDVEADVYLERYLHLVSTLADDAEHLSPHGEIWSGEPPVNISIKLSALCPHMEMAAPEWVSEVSLHRLRVLMRAAMQRRAFVNLDVEQYRYRDLAHRAFADLLLEPEFRSYEHVGIVVQAYLRDAEAQIEWLRELAIERGTPFSVRLVKGAYWDEEQIVADQNRWPVPVYTEKQDTDDNYDRCTDALIAARPHLQSAFGTHNPHSVAQAVVKAREAGSDVEFQMLYGMAEGLRRAVAKAGYRTRVYVPVGQVIPGMAYLVRRLLENTSNQAWFNAGAGALTSDPSPVARAIGLGSSRHATDPLYAMENMPPARFFEAEPRIQMRSAINARRAAFGKKYPLLIGEREVSDREMAPVTYPADQTVIGLVAQGTRDDVEAAVVAARGAFPGWRDTPARQRAERLRRAADIIEEKRFDLAALMVFESGKPWHEADGDVCEAADYLRYYAVQAEALETPRVIGSFAGEHNEYFHEGRGVAAIIAPWNFPLAIICGMSAGAIAGGNAVILKPAGESPIIAHELVRILRAAGVPDGVVECLPGPGSEVGKALVEHPGVDIIAFTGSSAVGLDIIEAAAKLRTGQANVKRVIAEMGGKNAIIIDEDADLDQAVSGVLTSAFGYAGQKCSACSRLIIVGSAYEETVARLKNAVESLVVGPPDRPETFVPPVISESARKKIQGYIDAAHDYATLLAQASAPDDGGSYVRPTVFAEVPPDSQLAREEVFGPVLAVFRAETFEEALTIAGNSQFALTGGLFSRNPRNIERARRAFRVGNLYINRKITGAVGARQPFGGMRMSGNAEKAGGPDYVRQFMEARVVTENLVRRGFAPQDGE